MKRVALVVSLLLPSCGGGSPTQPPPVPQTTVAAQPSPSPAPSASPAASSCPWGPFAPGPVARLAISPRALESNGARAPMRTRLVGPGEELFCLESEKSHRIDFNLNQRNAAGQESCWVDPPFYRIRADTDRIVFDQGPIDANGFILRIRVEPRGINEATFGVQAQLDGVFSHPWTSGANYPVEPLRVITLPGDEIARLCPCVWIGNGGYEPGSCRR